MKQILCLIICFFALTCSAQKYNWKRAIAPASISFVSGASWGLHEVTAHHWSSVQTKHPGLNPRFWNPAESWKNKYIGGNPELGRTRFAGVIIPAHITDAKHILASTNQLTAVGAGATIGFSIGIDIGRNKDKKQRRPWWHYGVDAAISFAAYSAGNALFYSKNGLMR